VLRNVGHNGQNIRWARTDSPGIYLGGATFIQQRFTSTTGDVGDIAGPWTPFFDDFAFYTAVEPAVSPTPEPGTALLLVTGCLVIARRRAALMS